MLGERSYLHYAVQHSYLCLHYYLEEIFWQFDCCDNFFSDESDHHNFELLKKLVFPDGSILRARFSGRPTRDCLFIEPVMD